MALKNWRVSGKDKNNEAANEEYLYLSYFQPSPYALALNRVPRKNHSGRYPQEMFL
jgi:hypothetical protein